MNAICFHIRLDPRDDGRLDRLDLLAGRRPVSQSLLLRAPHAAAGLPVAGD